MNDTRGWVLVHDQVRATIAAASQHVAALQAGDAAGARRLDAWWRSFSRSLAHHMRTEDDRIWPSLTAADADAAEALRGLTAEHRAITDLLIAVDSGFERIGGAPADLPGARAELLERLSRLGAAVGEHLDHEEATAFATGRDHVEAGEWARIEQDMVKGLSLKDVSTLLPRILQEASPEDRAMMLGRLPPPVRLIGERVFVPRYRRLQAQLPGSIH